jgi:hypothetical protein
VEAVGVGVLAVFLAGLVRQRGQIVHRLAVGVAHVEEGLAVVGGDVGIDAVARTLWRRPCVEDGSPLAS